MTEKVWLTVIKGCSTALAMVLIWRLVVAALNNGLDGVMFFGGIAAIAGLGGYEVRQLIDKVRSKTPPNPDAK